MVGISAINQSTTAIATPEVDQGSNIAIRTVSRSMLKIRAAGSCHAEKTLESPETPDSVLMASVIPDPLRGRDGSRIAKLTRPRRRNPAAPYSAARDRLPPRDWQERREFPAGRSHRAVEQTKLVDGE